MHPDQPTRFLLLNYMKLSVDAIDDVEAALKQVRATDSQLPRTLYRHDAGDRLLELVGLPELASLAALFEDPAWQECERIARPVLVADFRRQIYALRDVVKAPSVALPSGGRLLLSRGEIAPRALEAYWAWRAAAHDPLIREREEVDRFTAYHSVLSTEPGFLHLLEFSVELAALQRSLAASGHQELIQHASREYVLGQVATSTWTRR